MAVRVRIGKADRVLDAGAHDYVITLSHHAADRFLRELRRALLNATGNGWTFPIDSAEARITLPDAVPFKLSAFYTGPKGATGKDATIVEQAPGRIVFRTTSPLAAGHGLTVAAGWQKGVDHASDRAGSKHDLARAIICRSR